MAQYEDKSPRELFRERTTTPPYAPTEQDISWLADMKAASADRQAEEAFTAAATGHIWRLTQLLDMDVPADTEGQEEASQPNMSLLHIAVEKSKHAAAALLLSQGADANLPDESVGLPLVKAVKKGDVQMVCLLLHYNADPDETDDMGDCARDLAQMNPVVKSILEETALPRRSNKNAGPSL